MHVGAPWRRSPSIPLTIALAGLVLAGCSGGGGSGSSFQKVGELLTVEFPDPLDVNPEEDTDAPGTAPLNQQIVLRFSDAPNPDDVHRQHIRVQDAVGQPVEGRFDVDGATVTFTPALPTREPVVIDEETGEFDNGDAALEPGQVYSIRLGPQLWSFVGKVSADLLSRYADPADPNGVAVAFSTTTDVENYFRGLPPRNPRLVETLPADGSSNVSAQLYGDPDDLFDDRAPFRVVFDGPIFPADAALEAFRLVDLDDRDFDPAGLPLGVIATLLENEVDRAVIEVQASGILPFGHLLTLESPTELPGLSQEVPELFEEHQVLASFTVSSAPDEVVHDLLYEDFDTTERQDVDISSIEEGVLPANWDLLDSNVLEAGFAFEGQGQLGRFVPSAPESGTKTVVLDTNKQVFPLFDGSTPDAPPGFEVLGGKFHFSEIDIPKGVILEVRGSNPIVLTATGSVKINGTITVDGQNGADDNSFDSGVASMPGGRGGPGGGRGGEGHPILYFPPGSVSNLTLVSPQFGGSGWDPFGKQGPGGGGGECGIMDRKDDTGKYGTNQEIACNEFGHDNDSFAAGGGGGSYLSKGGVGRAGEGNVRADGQGLWDLTEKSKGDDEWNVLKNGKKGQTPFRDKLPNNDFIGPAGELTELQGGYGGGGGGSRTEAYYCGTDCLEDQDPNNDDRCMGGEFGGAFADSVGDARGGGGGGAGGAIMIQSLGQIELKPSCVLTAVGGRGGGGETLGNSNWGGPGGGGTGGAIVLQSAEMVVVRSKAKILVDGGSGKGSPGGHGIVQLQVPAGLAAQVENTNSISPPEAWVDSANKRNPALFTPISAATSVWYDMGRVTERPPENLNPVFAFRGTDDLGFVMTDDDGNVIDPGNASIRCDYLGQFDPFNPGGYKDGEEPRANYIPPTASVQVLFQGGDPVVPGSKEVDIKTMTTWEPDIEIASGLQFVRYKIVFDIAADGNPVHPESPRPAVQWISLDSEF